MAASYQKGDIKMKKNIILSFILVAFIAVLCATVMNIDEYYVSGFSSSANISITETKYQESMTEVNADKLDSSDANHDIELVKRHNY